jgi:hypothetical protein
MSQIVPAVSRGTAYLWHGRLARVSDVKEKQFIFAEKISSTSSAVHTGRTPLPQQRSGEAQKSTFSRDAKLSVSERALGRIVTVGPKEHSEKRSPSGRG